MLPLIVRCWLVRDVLQVAFRVHALARRVAGDDLQDARPDEYPVAFFEMGALDLLAVDERAVGGAQILDPDLVRLHRDPRVLSRNHVLDEHHVELARSADDNLPVGNDGKLATLVLSADEPKHVRPRPRPRYG
jgi:hypothetical protein